MEFTKKMGMIEQAKECQGMKEVESLSSPNSGQSYPDTDKVPSLWIPMFCLMSSANAFIWVYFRIYLIEECIWERSRAKTPQ